MVSMASCKLFKLPPSLRRDVFDRLVSRRTLFTTASVKAGGHKNPLVCIPKFTFRAFEASERLKTYFIEMYSSAACLNLDTERLIDDLGTTALRNAT